MKQATNIISTGITWVDGRLLFNHDTKWAKVWYGVCHFGDCVFAITPHDYIEPIMLTTISVSPTEDYCEKAYSCLNFKCPLNKFDKHVFESEFKDAGAFSLGLPIKIINKEEIPWWCEEPKYSRWKMFKIIPEGGRLEYKVQKDKS